MSTALEVNAALEQRLASMAGLPSVAWPNVKFEPVPSAPYFRVFNNMGIPVRWGIADGDSIVAVGTFQIDVCVPKGNGAGVAMGYADAIRNHFPTGLELTTATNGYKVRVETRTTQGGEVAGSHYCVPVVIEYKHITD